MYSTNQSKSRFPQILRRKLRIRKHTPITRAVAISTSFARCEWYSPNPSPTLIAPARHSRHILAHTSSQTISHRDLSLGSSRRLVYLPAIAWSRARRPCATPNMTVSSPRSSLDRSSSGIVTFTASRTLDVRFECLGVPMVCISNLGNTGSGYCNVVVALQRRSRHVQGKVLALWTSALYCNPKP